MCHDPLWLKFIESDIFTPCRTCVVLFDLHLSPFLLQPVLPRLLLLLCPDVP